MRTIDKIIPVIVIFLVGVIGYLLYENKYHTIDFNTEITENNIDKYFELNKRSVVKEYGEYDYKSTYNNKTFYCYKNISRCFQYNKKNKVNAIVLLGGNELNKINDIKAKEEIKLIKEKYKIEEQEIVIDKCKTIELNHQIKEYSIKYVSKSICDETKIENIDYIIIEE